VKVRRKSLRGVVRVACSAWRVSGARCLQRLPDCSQCVPEKAKSKQQLVE